MSSKIFFSWFKDLTAKWKEDGFLAKIKLFTSSNLIGSTLTRDLFQSHFLNTYTFFMELANFKFNYLMDLQSNTPMSFK